MKKRSIAVLTALVILLGLGAFTIACLPQKRVRLLRPIALSIIRGSTASRSLGLRSAPREST